MDITVGALGNDTHVTEARSLRRGGSIRSRRYLFSLYSEHAEGTDDDWTDDDHSRYGDDVNVVLENSADGDIGIPIKYTRMELGLLIYLRVCLSPARFYQLVVPFDRHLCYSHRHHRLSVHSVGGLLQFVALVHSCRYIV